MLHRLWVGIILTIPTLFWLLAKHAQVLSLRESLIGYNLSLSTPVVFFVGWPFFEKAWRSVVNRSLNMFTLIALGIGTAYLFSNSFKEKGELFVYFEATSVITVLVLLGQVLELKAKSQTDQAIKSLLSLSAKTAHLILDGQEQEIPIEQVKVGDLFEN